jgi:hypothetical protein
MLVLDQKLLILVRLLLLLDMPNNLVYLNQLDVAST